ncbi:hypothetical protein HNQ92_001373 [Rhabdobacter roseus]|uniref:Polysaccharide deacetylase n=1 Tax=Rhabdobacter roseus TaxID=1655419 RepID=A0A840TNA9_9BACT|nr:hypothetical protein [Rhabdobacter roseus]
MGALQSQSYRFQTFQQFLPAPNSRTVVLRHDVDLLPQNSLAFAQIQRQAGIRGTYYFRAVPESWNEAIIREIADLGHEIGYHYECLTTCGGDLEASIRDFDKNLTALRKIAPVQTICMHGSPMSKYDSKDLWKKYSYQDFGIMGEPYFDVDFSKVLYLTDTGRRWNGENVSVRDKVSSGFSFQFQNTNEIVRASVEGKLPDQIMFTFHPQRWTNDVFLWTKELVFQNMKNIIKRHFFMRR